MFITTIRPRSIVWGKMLATALLAVLIYSACMPFMTLTWLMRGVDLPTIFLVIVLGFCMVLAMIQAAIFAASLTTNLGFRVLLGLGLLALVIFGMTAAIGWSMALIFEGVPIDEPGVYWRIIGPVVFNTACVIALLQACAIAMISPPSSNRAPAPRVTFTVVTLAQAVIMFAFAYVDNTYELLGAWAITHVVLIALCMAIAVCERERWGYRVARTIPRNPLGRLGAFFFFSGSAGGLAWAGLLVGFVLLVLLAGRATMPVSLSDEFVPTQIVIGLGLFGYSYSMTALLIRRYLLPRFIRPEHTWSLVLVLLAIGSVLPMLPGYMVFKGAMWDVDPGPLKYWLATNPVALFVEPETRYAALFLVVPWALAVTVLAAPWIAGQIRRFGPSPPATDAQALDSSSPAPAE